MSSTTETNAGSYPPRVEIPMPTSSAVANEHLDAELKDAFARHEQVKPLFSDLAAVIQRYAQAKLVAFCRQGANGELVPLITAGTANAEQEETEWQALEAACLRTFESPDVFVGTLQSAKSNRVVAAPIFCPRGAPYVVAAILEDGPMQPSARIGVVDQVAGAASHWQTMQLMGRLDWEAQVSAAGVELVSRIETSDSLEAACFLTVEQLKTFFQCGKIALGLTPTEGTGARLVAMSDMAEFDRSSRTVTAFQYALDEAVVREQLTAWPPLDSQQRHATLAHRKLIEEIKIESVLSIPLTSVHEERVGAIVVVGPRQILHRPPRIHALEALAPHIATALHTRAKLRPSRLSTLWQAGVGKRGSHKRRVALAGALVMCALLPLCPWRHKIRNDCRVEPVIRRFTAVPYDGILQRSLVRPGDLVKAGQVLASMDDRELRWELSGFIAERGRVAKQRDVAMASHDTSEKQMAQLEMQRLDQKIELYQHRESSLDVTSPIDGVILKGDLEDAEGAPVKVGQSLFEIAPLHRVKLELAILEDDLPAIEEGMAVHARLDGLQSRVVTGQVERIFPRSEIRDGHNVFLAEVTLDNPDGLIRPGMSGQAKIRSHFRPLGWIWFHKAWHKMRNWVG